MPTQFVISEVTRNFLQIQLENHIEELLDDPDGMFGPEDAPETRAELRKHYDELSIVAADLGLSLSDIIANNDRTDYERERLATMLGWNPGFFIKGATGIDTLPK